MFHYFQKWLLIFFILLNISPPAFAETADLNKPTISGISSGAFMAVQMGTIFSNQFSGLGTVAGGFFYCAQNHLQEKIAEGQLNLLGAKNLFLYSTTNLIASNSSRWFEPAVANPIYQSVAICMHNPNSATRPDMKKLAAENKVLPLDNFKNLKIYIYQGENDSVVHKEMAEQLISFYTENQLPAEQITISKGQGGHNFPHVALHGCEMSDSFNKDFDESYAEQISKYQNLSMRKKSEVLINFLGLPYIEQKTNKYGALKFVLNAGYIDYAEKNNLMILFPQTWITEDNYPYNPKGCWDWFGWTGSNYATQSGIEPSWLSSYISEVSKDPAQFILSTRPQFDALKH